MNRLSFEEYAVALALLASVRSEDPHTKVGCCLLDEHGKVISTGYNGLAKGMILPDWMKENDLRARKSKFMIHAETNAFALTLGRSVSLVGLTTTPCSACAVRMIPYGVKKVVYYNQHERYQDFREIFDFYGIEHYELSPLQKQNIKDSLSIVYEK